MAAPPTDTLRDLDVAATSHRGDRIFNRGITVAAFTALLVLAGIAIFLGIAAVEAITTQGWSFLFTTEWKVDQGDEPVAGIWGMLYGSVLLAVIGLVIAFPDDPQLAKIGSGAMTLSVEDQGNIAATPAVGGIPDDEIFDLAASKIILQEDQPVVGWPVLGTGHLLVCDDPADPLPLSLAQYALRLAGQGALETYGLTPLPEPVRIKTFEPLKVPVAGEN